MATPDQAGHRLRALREAQKLTQRDILLKTHGVLTNQQISRIEKGQIDKPPMRDLVLYGNILGMSPNEIAALYGYWEASADTATAQDHPYIARLRSLLRTLPPDAKARLLHDLEFDIAQAVARAAP